MTHAPKGVPLDPAARRAHVRPEGTRSVGWSEAQQASQRGVLPRGQWPEEVSPLLAGHPSGGASEPPGKLSPRH